MMAVVIYQHLSTNSDDSVSECVSACIAWRRARWRACLSSWA